MFMMEVAARIGETSYGEPARKVSTLRVPGSDCQSAITAPHVKQQLHDNTSLAVQNGVFGVPALLIGTEIFWGHDSLEMAADFWRNRDMSATPQMAAADALPLGSVRRQP